MNLEQYVVTTPEGERATFALPNGIAIPIHHVIAQMSFDAQKVYAQAYGDAWAEAFNAQGQAAFEAPKASAAIHEAGHVVVGTLDGFSFTWSRIWRERCDVSGWVGWAGWTDCEDSQKIFLGTPDQILCGARQVMAGYMAERVFEGEAAREGSSLDERVAAFCLTTMAAAELQRDPADMIRETENNVGNLLLQNEAQLRKIANAIAKAAPLKLKGKRLEALVSPLKQCEATKIAA